MNSAALTASNTARAKALRPLTPGRLFGLALRQVESDSIRAWANGQRKTWLKITAGWMRANRYSESEAVLRLSTFIVCTAIGA